MRTQPLQFFKIQRRTLFVLRMSFFSELNCSQNECEWQLTIFFQLFYLSGPNKDLPT